MSKTVPNTAETPLPAAVPAPGELGPLVGKTFGGYEVSSYIGEGPTGQVYRVLDLMGAKMAVKVMHRELSQKEHAQRLWEQLKKLAATGDEHFVRVYDCGYGDDGDFFFLMDELSGVDLEAALEESGAFAPRRAVEIIDGVAAALERAHTEGVIHGGLKPRNVFLSPTGGKLTVKVLDFGAARLAGGVDKGVIVGNPFYMAPEQFGGNSDERTDVYSLGVMMYELFSGTLPFNGPTHGQVMMRHLAEPPQPPPGVDAQLAKIILKALAKAPSDRFSSVAELRDALRAWAKDARTLEDAAASQVIARAAEARKIKQAALTTPDATVPASKLDAAELAEATRQQLEPSGSNKRGGNGSMNTTTRKEDNPNSSESVEASLEDFISQANATFPASDGWDLHTGDVELVDDEEGLESEEHVAAPLVVNPAQRKAETAAHLIKKADQSARSRKVTAAMLEDPNAKTTVAPAPTRSTRRNPFEVEIPLEQEEAEPAPLDPPPTGPRRRAERTEVVASPLARSVPWTANPMVWIAGVFAAFVAGAVLVFAMVRTMMPSQPVVVQAPAPVVVPPAASAAAAQPVVTPLDKPAAKAPVVTPLEEPKQAAADEAPAPVEKKAAAKHVAAKHAAAKAAPVAAAPKSSAPVAKAEPRKSAKAAASDDDDDDDAPAAPAPKKAAKKSAGKSDKKPSGGDWVDPFAQ